MITHKKIDSMHFHKTLIIDIETVPLTDDWFSLPEGLRNHWIHKMNFLHLSDEQKQDPAAIFNDRAGIYSEFGKIVCIGMGYISKQDGKEVVRLKSLSNDNEMLLLQEFCKTLTHLKEQNKEVIFCGHADQWPRTA
jgi:hypothetical protein